MPKIYDDFNTALQSRLGNENLSAFAEATGGFLPASARQAKIPVETINQATADALGIPFLESLAELPVSNKFIEKVSIAFARQHSLICLGDKDGCVAMAMCDFQQWPQLQVLSKILDTPLRVIFAPRTEIHRAINAAYQQQTGQAQQVIEEMDSDEVMRVVDEAGRNEDLLDVSARAPVIKLVNLILFEAVKRSASDVHIQPYEDSLVVRFRVDGILFDMFNPPKALQEEIISRVKIMGGMNIAERRLPQDGRATVEVGSKVVDLRIASLPTCYGERAVLRLLDKSARLFELQQLGMPQAVLQKFRKLIGRDHGIILVTGPTGSGKSTTLYAALQEINSKQLNVLTLEDPIEYRLEGISQTQINTKKGMTFASGLRNVLRQDPDIIMVGEIRDAETASMAIQAALTGHLVFSTLHTNDAAGAVARLLDLEVEPYLVASSLLGVLAQRLLRRICDNCRTSYQPDASEFDRVDLEDMAESEFNFSKGCGCDECMDTGYRGRDGIFELLTVDENIRQLIVRHAKASNIKSAAIEAGMQTLRVDGLHKAARGVTTLEEVTRVTSRDET